MPSAGFPMRLRSLALEPSSTAAYDGSRFAPDGVIRVVINRRAGEEGFLYLGVVSQTSACPIRWRRWSGCGTTS